MKRDKILIIGGYGAVGKIIATQLSQVLPGKIIIAGRSLLKAQTLASRYGSEMQAIHLDVDDVSSFNIPKDVKLAIMCLDIPNNNLVSHLVELGIDYMDITASYDVMQNITVLDERAKQKKVGIYFSIGLAPGLSNLLASYLIKQCATIDQLDLYILLGLGEAHGDKAFQWTFDNINSKYEAKDLTKYEQLKSFTDRKKTDLAGTRSFYLFNFSDQHVLSQTFPTKRIRTRLAFDIRILTQLVAWMRRWGLSRIYTSAWVQQLMIKLLKKKFVGSDIYGVKALASVDGKTLSAQILGKEEGKTTALVASLMAQKIYRGNEQYGVQHIHQCIHDVPAFLQELQQLDASIQFHLHEN